MLVYLLLLPLPNSLDELLPAELVARLLLLAPQLLLHHDLCSDTRVVAAGVP